MSNPIEENSRIVKYRADVSRLERSIITYQNTPTEEKSRDATWEFIVDSKAKSPESTFLSARQKKTLFHGRRLGSREGLSL